MKGETRSSPVGARAVMLALSRISKEWIVKKSLLVGGLIGLLSLPSLRPSFVSFVSSALGEISQNRTRRSAESANRISRDKIDFQSSRSRVP